MPPCSSPQVPNLLPFLWNMPSVWVGNTYPAFIIKGKSEPNGITLTRVKMVIKDADENVIISLDSNASTITILDAARWDFQTTAFALPLSAAVYTYEIETTNSASVVRTILHGSIQAKNK